jgi:GNAT superfamily N-acetyltransferase
VAHTLRPATSDDEAFLWEMLYTALFIPPGGDPLPREIVHDPDLAVYVDDFGHRSGDDGLVAEDEAGVSIGAAWVRQMTSARPGYGFVDASTPEIAIAVTADYRNRGLGSALLSALLTGLPRCSLSVDERSPAVRLYERFGFRAVRREGVSLTMVRCGG